MAIGNSFHVIKDPVHGTMQFTTTENAWIKPFIDSPHFQRLRHIKQAGMGDYIFPGSVHTRFNHSLGCCYIASQISKKIDLPEEERQLVLIACLLHDIGHGPFSHTFEDLFHDKLIRHEAWTPHFLSSYKTQEFFDFYNQCNPHYPLTIEKFQQIENMIMHKLPRKQLLADIVSSQLDADRLDYLLRDSHFCGVSYGQFDFRWMINSMAVIDTAKGKRLGITHKGVGVVEHYLMARRLMIRNIYHHPKKLAIEYYMVQLLVHLAECLEKHAPFAHVKNSLLGKFLLQAHYFNREITPKTDLQQHKQLFIDKNYSDYKELSDYDVFSAIKWLANNNETHPAIDLAKRLQLRQMPKTVLLDQNNIADIEAKINDFKYTHQHSIQDWQFTMIKTPLQSYTIEDDPILVVDDRNEVRPINELSIMIDAISDKYEHSVFLCIDQAILAEKEVKQFLEALTLNSREKIRNV
ncbi:hypothetical protein AYO45_06475 [Gammaproteobacteria bacterium SCGC AG-212-F23]|nr:hypothetical protein AYO45_06475 [Gammaproteobacteria bacterium SCGC AG-212-F23]